MRLFLVCFLFIFFLGCNKTKVDMPQGEISGGAQASPVSFSAALVVSDIADTSLRLSWDNLSGVDNYIVYSSSGGTFTPVASTSGGVSTARITGLTPSTAYQFRVRLVDVDGLINDSQVISTSTLASIAGVSLLRIDPVGASPFSDSDDTPEFEVGGVLDGDLVELFNTSNCTGPALVTSTAGNGALRTMTPTLGPGTHTIRYKVTRHGNSYYSVCSTSTDVYTVLAGVPGTPSLSLQFPSISSHISLNPVARATSIAAGDTLTFYRDSQCLTNVMGTVLSSGSALDFTIPTGELTQAGTTQNYAFYVKRTVGGIDSLCSPALNYSVLPSLSASITPSIIAMTPSPGTDDTPTFTVGAIPALSSGSWIVELYGGANCSGSVLGSTTSTGSDVNITTSSLSTGAHMLRAKLTHSLVSGYSVCSDDTASYSLRPLAPTLSMVTPATNSDSDLTPEIRASGIQSGDVVQFYLGSCPAGAIGASQFSSGVTLDFTVPSGNMTTGNTYSLFATSTRNSVQSACSSVLSYTTTACPANYATNLAGTSCVPSFSPGGSVTAATETTLTLSWSAWGGAASVYKVDRYNGSAWVLASTTSGTSVTISGLTASTSYSFRVRVQDNSSLEDENITSFSGTTEASITQPTISASTPASPNGSGAPQFTIGNIPTVGSGSWTVELHNTADCSGTALASTTSTGSAVSLTPSSALSVGTHTLRAKLIRSTNSLYNICGSNTSIYRRMPVTPSVARQNPASSPTIMTTPTVKVSNVEPGDTVRIYSNSSCASLLSTATANGTTYDYTSGVLAAGTHEFYATTERNGSLSDCSSVFASYEIGACPANNKVNQAGTTCVPDFAPGASIMTLVADTSIQLTWTDWAGSESFYQVSRSFGGIFLPIGIVNSGTLTYLVTGLSASTSYSFRVNVIDGSGVSDEEDLILMEDRVTVSTAATIPGLTLATTPATSGFDTTPDVTVSISSGAYLAGDRVRLYSDASCANAISSESPAAAGGETQIVVTTNALDTGATNIYAKLTQRNSNTNYQSACAGAIAYTVSSCPSPATMSNGKCLPLLSLEHPVSRGNTSGNRSFLKTIRVRLEGVPAGATTALKLGNCTTGVSPAGIILDTANSTDNTKIYIVNSTILNQANYGFARGPAGPSANANYTFVAEVNGVCDDSNTLTYYQTACPLGFEAVPAERPELETFSGLRRYTNQIVSSALVTRLMPVEEFCVMKNEARMWRDTSNMRFYTLSTTAGSSTISLPASDSEIQVGDWVLGNGLGSNATVITSITGSNLTLSHNISSSQTNKGFSFIRPTVTATGSTNTITLNRLDLTSGNCSIQVGDYVSGPHLGASFTTVTAINGACNQITLSQNGTGGSTPNAGYSFTRLSSLAGNRLLDSIHELDDSGNSTTTPDTSGNWMVNPPSKTFPYFLNTNQESNNTSSISVFTNSSQFQRNGGIGTSQVVFPVSIANGSPWRYIVFPAAATACQSLGTNFDIISNSEFMTISRNLETTKANWVRETIGGRTTDLAPVASGDYLVNGNQGLHAGNDATNVPGLSNLFYRMRTVDYNDTNVLSQDRITKYFTISGTNNHSLTPNQVTVSAADAAKVEVGMWLDASPFGTAGVRIVAKVGTTLTLSVNATSSTTTTYHVYPQQQLQSFSGIPGGAITVSTRARNVLSTGENLWDISGNIAELVSATKTTLTDTMTPSNNGDYDSDFLFSAQGYVTGAHNTGQVIFPGGPTGVQRGGSFAQTNSGLFHFAGQSTGGSDTFLGFRCVFRHRNIY